MSTAEPDEEPPLDDQRFALVLEEARRAVDLQVQAADQARARASTILGVATIAGSFLGPAARDVRDPIPGLLPLAVVAFGVAAVAAAVALAPCTFKVSSSARQLLKDRLIGDDAVTFTQLRWSLAETYDEWQEHNERPLNVIWWAVTVGAIAVAAEVLALLAVLLL